MTGNKDMNCTIMQSIKEALHFHMDMEALYCVMGNGTVNVGNNVFRLKKGDVIAINSGIEHSIKCGGEDVLCRVTYSHSLLSSVLHFQNSFFVCNSVSDPGHDYDGIKTIFRDLVLERLNGENANECNLRSLMYRLLGLLIEECLLDRNKKKERGVKEEDYRVEEMMEYVHLNFGGNINLADLAEKLYTSTSTLSRLFKKNQGMYFTDYVNQIRMHYAVQGLIYSDENITKIAVDSGFSNLSVFNRVFREMYAMSPSEYRKEKRRVVNREEHENSVMIRSLRDKLKAELQEQDITGVCISVSEKQKYKKVWNYTINVGAISNLLMANTQYHVVYLADNLKFSHVRLWNIFSTQMMVTDGETMGNYSYDKIDSVFDFLDQQKIFPFLDFGIRPNAAVRKENDSVYFGEEGILFQNRQIWEDIIENFLRHVVKRYGKEKVGNWIFELSYDMTHMVQCYKDENYEYFRAYQYFYRTIKKFVPEARVGGPMGIAHFQKEFLREFLTKSKKYDCIPDFVSVILFPYTTVRQGDKIRYKIADSTSYEEDEVNTIHTLLDEVEVDCKIYIAEWNCSVSSRNYLNDSCYRAAYFVEKIEKLWQRVDMINLWMASDWVSNYYDVRGVANGGNGLLTKDTICKPAYYAMQFLNTLGDYFLQKGKGYIATVTEQQAVYILCWNYKGLAGRRQMECGDIDAPNQIKSIYEGKSDNHIEIVLENMKPARYIVKKHSIHPREGSLLYEWGKFNYENSLSNQDVKYIRQICFPRVGLKKVDVEEGILKFSETITPYGMMLIHIYEE